MLFIVSCFFALRPCAALAARLAKKRRKFVLHMMGRKPPPRKLPPMILKREGEAACIFLYVGGVKGAIYAGKNGIIR